MIVTIVTPTLNAVDYLKECIESARRNATRGIEIEHDVSSITMMKRSGACWPLSYR